MDTFFFVPANSLEFIRKAKKLKADFLIFDLEDSVLSKDIKQGINYLKSYTDHDHARCFIRVPYLPSQPYYIIDTIKELKKIGFNQFVFPKIEQKNQLENIYNSIPSLKKHNQILLVEHPKLLLQLYSVLTDFCFYALALGSHDYTAFMNMEHSKNNLIWSKHYLLNHAKAFNIKCLDLASMNIQDKSSFEQECIEANSLGFDGKLLIHPMQLNVINNVKFYTQEDVDFALKVREKIKEVGGIENYGVHTILGVVVEKPHLKKHLNILKKEGYEPI